MKILLVDDDALVTSGIAIILKAKAKEWGLQIDTVGIGRDGNEAIRLYGTHVPDVVLMDIRMPNMLGIEAGKIIQAKYPDARIIYLTTFLEDDYIIEALRSGAKGYLLKTDYEALLPAIEAVEQGHRVFGDEIIEKMPTYLDMAEHTAAASKLAPLDPRLSEKDHELIYWVAQGMNNKEIANMMHFSEGTIRNYISEILEKLGVRDRTQLAIYYFKHVDGHH
ncbi:response regulator transcription factor [Aerococcus sp. 1KP-2016]|uniref:response regulator transcription factor n=1 Tax=Aerococcus sp. 1KP-2016 TaxID=1981982 RepID=UPI000B983AA0|nr:response regulator transcription factor [Aerococcus sp. 1KP-2016]OYQ65971.1 DNA-binding response regulator [Aerococcus sp. 1KP-2016]